MQKYVVKNIRRPEQSAVDSFKEHDTSTVYEAQGKQGLLSNELKTISAGSKICGPAVTVTCPAGDNLMIHAAIEVCKPGDVLVVTTIGESISGMIGELIALALMKRGVQGLVIHAGVRDVARLRELGFSVWSKAVYSQGTTKSRGGWVNAPAVCGGTQIVPGDLIIADDDGVVVVAQEDIPSTLESVLQRVRKEEQTKEKIARGELSLDFYGLRSVLEQEKVVYLDEMPRTGVVGRA